MDHPPLQVSISLPMSGHGWENRFSGLPHLSLRQLVMSQGAQHHYRALLSTSGMRKKTRSRKPQTFSKLTPDAAVWAVVGSTQTQCISWFPKFSSFPHP